jgi:hypothetical protein
VSQIVVTYKKRRIPHNINVMYKKNKIFKKAIYILLASIFVSNLSISLAEKTTIKLHGSFSHIPSLAIVDSETIIITYPSGSRLAQEGDKRDSNPLQMQRIEVGDEIPSDSPGEILSNSPTIKFLGIEEGKAIFESRDNEGYRNEIYWVEPYKNYESYDVQIIGSDDPGFHSLSCRISFESLDNKKVFKFVVPQRHLFLKTLGLGYGQVRFCNKKDFSGLPKFRIHVSGDRHLIAWEKIE